MAVDLDADTCIDGKDMKVRDVPYPDSVLFGIGHDPAYKTERREVQPGDWPFTPEGCQKAGEITANTWNDEGTVLACNGCGLDCT